MIFFNKSLLDSHLSDSADDSSEDQGEQGLIKENHSEVSYFAYLSWKRNSIKRVGAVHC